MRQRHSPPGPIDVIQQAGGPSAPDDEEERSEHGLTSLDPSSDAPVRADHRAPAAHRAADVLRVVAHARHPFSLSAIASAIDAPKTSTMGICHGLVQERLLTRGSDGRYWLGPRIVELAASARFRPSPIRKVGLTLPSAANAFYLAELRAAESEAKGQGIVLVAASANDDITTQRAQIIEFVEGGADFIIVDPISSEGLLGALDYARRHAVPVIAVNAAAQGADLAIATDNALAGALAARYLVAHLPASARVVIIDGTRLTATADRVHGFTEALRESEGIRIIDYARGDNGRSEGRRIARHMLAVHPVIDAFFTINDPTAFGVLDVCVELGMNTAIASVDGSREMTNLIRSGDRLLCSAIQNPARLITSAFRFGRALCNGYQPIQGAIFLPSALATVETVGEYQPW